MTYISPPPPHPLGQHRPMIETELARRGLDWSGRKVTRQPPDEAEADQPGGEEDQEGAKWPLFYIPASAGDSA